MRAIILAAPDLLVEPSLVAAAGPAGLKVLRRCVDASDLLACAAAEPSAAVVISAGVPRLSGDLIARIQPTGRLVIALVSDDQDEARVRAWGITWVVRLGEAQATAGAVADLLNRTELQAASRTAPDADVIDTGVFDTGVFDTGVWSGSDQGAIVSVWGPPGAPGRTCTAIGLAEALVAAGHRVLLVDADVQAPSIAMMLGMVDEASGLIVACRHADNGTLSPRTLRSSARELRPGLAVLTGLPRPERWPDARAGALESLWQTCRASFEITVVDVGADLLQDTHGSVNPVLGGRRTAAARTALDHSDVVTCVCRADPLGLTRLALAYPALVEAAPDAPRVIGVVTADRDRTSWGQVTAALTGVGVDDPAVRLEPVPGRIRRRLTRGLLPSESGSRRRERAGLTALAQVVVAHASQARTRSHSSL